MSLLGFKSVGALAVGQLPTAGPFNSQGRIPPPSPVKIATRDSSVGLNLDLFKNPIPFNKLDWAVQSFLRPRAPNDASRQTNINLFTNPIPFFNKTNGGLPRTVSGVPAQPYNNALYTVTVVAAPFYQTAWPVPKAPQPSVPFVQTDTLSNLLAQPLIGPDYSSSKFQPLRAPDATQQTNVNLFTNPIPFSQTDWSKTGLQSPRAPDQQAYNLAVYGVTVSAPFYQTNWPIPRFPVPLLGLAQPNTLINLLAQPLVQPDWSRSSFLNPRAFDATQQSNINLFINPVPFSQTDWSRSAPQPLPAARQAEPYNTSLFTVTIAAAPFYQTDWSRPNLRTPQQVTPLYNVALFNANVTASLNVTEDDDILSASAVGQIIIIDTHDGGHTKRGSIRKAKAKEKSVREEILAAVAAQSPLVISSTPIHAPMKIETEDEDEIVLMLLAD